MSGTQLLTTSAGSRSCGTKRSSPHSSAMLELLEELRQRHAAVAHRPAGVLVAGDRHAST